MDELMRQNLSYRLTFCCLKASHLAIPDSEGTGSTALCSPPAGGHHSAHRHGSCHATKLWTVASVSPREPVQAVVFTFWTLSHAAPAPSRHQPPDG